MSELREKMRKKRQKERLTVLVAFLLSLSLILVLLLLLFFKKQNAQQPDKQPAAIGTEAMSDQKPEAVTIETPSSPEADTPTSSGIVSENKPEETPENTTLIFTGDVLLSGYVLDNYNAGGIDGVLSPELLTEMTNADITMINNEFPYSLRGEQAPDKQYTFRIDPKYVSVLSDMGVDIAGLANNHVLDYGKDALLDTFETLDRAGIDYVGSGDSFDRASALITKTVHGKTFGFLAASRVIPVVSWDITNAAPGVFTTYDPAKLCAAIEQARSQCDYLTVFVHWGIERSEFPESYQRVLAEQYIDSGADLVVGMHPHVLQGISYYKDKPIFYSLGNFIFNQSIPQTALLKVTIAADNTPTFQLLAANASGAKTGQLEGEEKLAVYRYLESISTDISINEDGIVSH